MIVDVTPSALDYDPTSDVATLHFSRFSPPSSVPPRTPAEREVKAQLLLDASGHLVGVDLGDAFRARRLVAMLGPHEAVANMREARVALAEERTSSEGDGLIAIRIGGAREAIRGAEKSPYIK